MVLNGREPPDRVRITFDKADQLRQLRAGTGAPLLAIFQPADVGSEIDGEEDARESKNYQNLDKHWLKPHIVLLFAHSTHQAVSMLRGDF